MKLIELRNIALALLLFCTPSFAWDSNDAQKLDTKVALQMWFGINSPTKNEIKYFTDVKRSMDKFTSNNIVIEHAAIRDGADLFSDEYIAKKISTEFRANKIHDSFFYDFEKSQIFAMVKMTMNYCKLSGDCPTNNTASKIINFAYSKTATGRAKQRSKNSISSDDLLASVVFGTAAFVFFSGVNEMMKAPASDSKKYTKAVEISRCETDELCFSPINTETGKMTFMCTKGPYKGNKMSVCANGNGKWATGCGFSDVFAHHDKNSTDAANKACGAGSWW